jgi:hypothetical protein
MWDSRPMFPDTFSHAFLTLYYLSLANYKMGGIPHILRF